MKTVFISLLLMAGCATTQPQMIGSFQSIVESYGPPQSCEQTAENRKTCAFVYQSAPCFDRVSIATFENDTAVATKDSITRKPCNQQPQPNPYYEWKKATH